MLYATNIAVKQELIVAAVMIEPFILHTSDVHQHTLNRVE